MNEGKRRRVSWFHRNLANPTMRRIAGYLPGQAVLETTGRRSGRPRRTPIGGRFEGTDFWLVSDHGAHSDYVRNIQANPRVRLQAGGRWYTGTAHLLPDDDPQQRLRKLPRLNSTMVRLLGTNHLTIRIAVDESDS
jgi:deazaflavin-dependent oxidoreductase (nitroreductase family)